MICSGTGWPVGPAPKRFPLLLSIHQCAAFSPLSRTLRPGDAMDGKKYFQKVNLGSHNRNHHSDMHWNVAFDGAVFFYADDDQ